MENRLKQQKKTQFYEDRRSEGDFFFKWNENQPTLPTYCFYSCHVFIEIYLTNRQKGTYCIVITSSLCYDNSFIILVIWFFVDSETIWNFKNNFLFCLMTNFHWTNVRNLKLCPHLNSSVNLFANFIHGEQRDGYVICGRRKDNFSWTFPHTKMKILFGLF